MAPIGFQLYNNLWIHTTDERFIIESQDASELLVIDRLNDTIHHEINSNQLRDVQKSTQRIHGIIGIINLIAGPYLIVISKADKVADINGHSIYQVTQTELLSFRKTTTHLTEDQVSYNNVYLSMIRQVLSTPSFYFSYSYDLSHSLQRQHINWPDYIQQSLIDKCDFRFVWNQNLLSRFKTPEFHRYALPIIHGYVSCNRFEINSNRFSLILVSRRSIQRAGTRLLVRGSDLEGNVANFVETEQIIELPNVITSFVQIRGSIPLVWNQLPNIKYKPKLLLNKSCNQQEVFQRHVDHLLSIYGKICMISLINQHGQESKLGTEFSKVVSCFCQSSSVLNYEPFDFHAECGQKNWHRLDKLMTRISPEQQEMSCFTISKEGNILSAQDGIFRTNCIDSLDRTNVVQSLIARKNLEEQLIKFGILQAGQKVEHFDRANQLYRIVWADNGDHCSTQYAGTGALKSDFTRTGKRSAMGLMKDGMNSMIRYYKNNFADGFRQDAIDLFLGNYLVAENEGKTAPCPLKEQKDWKYLALPTFLLASISMFFMTALIPPEHSTETYLYLLFWGGMISFTGGMIVYYGSEFVDSPKLVKKNQ